MANKYNWSLIPSHVNYMATDEDGMACGWLVEPQIQGDAWRHQSHLSAYFNINAKDNYLKHFQGNWRESLEQRPDNRITVKEAFLKVFSNSLHYEACIEKSPGNSDDFIFSYCYESDDFIDPVTSDAYLVFKSLYTENLDLKSRIENALKITGKMATSINTVAIWAVDLDHVLNGVSNEN